MSWKKISSKIILNNPRLKVIEDIVVLPSGKKIDYLKFENVGSVATLICKNSEGKILIQKEYSYPPNEVLYQLPGGFIPTNEDVAIGANRELMEEVGLFSNKMTLLGSFFPNNRRSDAKNYVYLCEELEEKRLVADDEEDIKSYWLTEDEIDQLILNDELKNNGALASLLLYKVKKSTIK